MALRSCRDLHRGCLIHNFTGRFVLGHEWSHSQAVKSDPFDINRTIHWPGTAAGGKDRWDLERRQSCGGRCNRYRFDAFLPKQVVQDSTDFRFLAVACKNTPFAGTLELLVLSPHLTRT